MGYCTTYRLDYTYNRSLFPTSYDTNLHKDILNTFDFLNSYLEVQELKWYEHEAELRTFSTKHLEVLFILTGIGEDHNIKVKTVEADMWIKYFLNGKSYTDYLKYEFPEFDINKLE